MTLDRELIRFNALRNALYHTARRLTFDRWNRWGNAFVLLLGAASMSQVLTVYGIRELWVGAAVAIVGSLQLVFDFGGRARDHQSLQRDYFHLLAEIEEVPAPDELQLAKWSGRMMKIAGEEPPMLRALDAKAYNDAIDASGLFPASERVIIPVLHKLFGNFWAFEGYSYRKIGESRVMIPAVDLPNAAE